MPTLQSLIRAPRRVRLLALLFLAVALLAIPAGSPPSTNAAGTIIAQQDVSTGSDMSEAPQISVGSDRLGVSWGERFDQRLGTNNTTIGTAFPSPTYFGTGGANFAYQFPDVAVDKDGNIHVAYAVDDQIYYKRKLKGAGWESPRPVARDNFPNPVRIAVGSDGTIWVIWRDNDGTGIFYRRSTDGSKWTNGSDGGKVHAEGGNMYAPDVAVGSDNAPHVVWYIRGSGTNKGQIRVADWNGSSFTTSSVTTDSLYDADPAIAVDNTNVQHVVWRKQLSDTQWAITYANRAASGSWQNFTTLAVTNGDAAYSPAVAVDEKRNVFATYSNPSGRTRQVELYGKTATGSWEKVLEMPPVNWDSRNAVAAKNGEAHVAYQVEHNGKNDGQIHYARVNFNSVPPMSATPTLAGGVGTTNQNPVRVSFTDVNGNPTQIRWRWGAAPTDSANDSNGWQTFANPMSIALPANTSTSVCQNLVLYTQVRNTTIVQQGSSNDAVKYDGAAQANVTVSNPYLNGLPATFTQHVQDTYNTATDGAYNGNPNYTRVPQFYLAINNNNDCSGLTSFLIPATNTSGSLTTGSYVKIISMPQGSFPNPGTKVRIDVVVSDGIGNITSYPKDIIYDPANTAQSGTPNTDGLPTYKGGSATVSTDNSILRTLTFQNVSVNDTVYGQFENLPAGSQFWGVWIANSTTPVNNPNSSGLQWFPVEVRNPSSNFTVSWNLFNGIAPANRKPGTYYIYIKFLDGAGNATVGTVPAVQATLAQGYKVPTLYLPHVRK